MVANNEERQIAAALHTLVDLVVAPWLADFRNRERIVDVIGANLTLAQAAKALGVSPKTVNRWCSAKKILSTGEGKTLRIEQREIERFNTTRRQEPG
jgi:excisionase family DNA binding protein